MIAKPFNDHFKFATDLTIIAKGNVSEIGPWTINNFEEYKQCAFKTWSRRIFDLAYSFRLLMVQSHMALEHTVSCSRTIYGPGPLIEAKISKKLTVHLANTQHFCTEHFHMMSTTN